MPQTTPDLTTDQIPLPGSITMFTTSWCGYCVRLKGQLERAGIAYNEINLESSPEHIDYVESVNGGNRTVPTVVFPDGSSATNPSLLQVQERLGA